MRMLEKEAEKSGRKRLQTIFQYPEGSFFIVPKILKLIPPHNVYVEVFGGAACLLFNKEPARVEVYNDINGELVNFFRVLRDDTKWKILQEKLALTPYARAEFEEACRAPTGELDDVERARRFYVRVQMSFGGKGKTFGYAVAKNLPLSYYNKIALFPAFHDRLKNVIIENDDFEKIFRRYDSPETFFFCDPPYIRHSIRSDFLNLEMSEEDHRRLIETVLNVKGKVLLLGFRHQLYEQLTAAGWRAVSLRVPICIRNPHQTGGKRSHQYRYAWMNYKL